MSAPLFIEYVQPQDRDEYGRLIHAYPTCVLCGDGGIVDVEMRCKACWRVVVLTPRGGALTYVPKPVEVKP